MIKTVLITGCSTGLGHTAARKFADEGWNVVATMRKPDQSLAAENPERIFVTELDVTKPASIGTAIAAGIARFGKIDAVVNNAGGQHPRTFLRRRPWTRSAAFSRRTSSVR
ncbi:SDR family NAD(P)-dependent oxidoreductase [Cohnella rhizosphaerae]|uniref:SDR family NAD(P)-dependent oxidoreductase n=1 Tax=Cohnella rhizosphaerae TaxID=1457232 RepID=UPI003B8A721B